jgi:hypothetical protein
MWTGSLSLVGLFNAETHRNALVPPVDPPKSGDTRGGHRNREEEVRSTTRVAAASRLSD